MSIYTSYNLPTTITPNSVPSADWMTPENILLVDGQFAIASGPANILTVGTFNPGVPYGATILDITLQVVGYRGVNPVNLSIYAVDDFTGVTYSYPLTPPFSGFDGTNTFYTLTPTLFGTTWDSDTVNNIKFTLIADNTLYLDAVLMRVQYIPAIVPPPIPTPAADVVIDEFVEAQPFDFAMSLSATDLYLFLKTFTYPDGTPIQFADFHTTTEAYLVLDQGIPGKEEVVRITAVEQDYGGSGLCRISFTTLDNRGLGYQWPYESVPSLIVSHGSTAQAVISNPAVFYSRFLRISQIGGLVNQVVTVQENGTLVIANPDTLNFTGDGQSTTNPSGNHAQITITDHNVRVDSSDTTPAGLAAKLVAGTGISLTVLSPGGDEQIEITNTGGGGSGITSINGDTTAAQVIAAGTGISVTSTGGTTTITNTGGGGSGITSINGNTTAAQVITAGAGISVTSTGGTTTIVNTGSVSGSSIVESVHQVAHGFSQGKLLKSAGTSDTYALAKGDTTSDAEVVGIVTSVIDADNFVYSQNIMGYTGSGIPSGTPGEGVFLDQSTPGAMTLTPDTSTSGLIVKPVGVLISSSSAKMNFSSSYLGTINP